MKLWLDDVRPMPNDYDVWIQDVNTAVYLIKSGHVDELSLDHDLGDGLVTGYDVAKLIEESAYNYDVKRIICHCHSANPVGKQQIEAAFKKADKFWKEWEGKDRNFIL